MAEILAAVLVLALGGAAAILVLRLVARETNASRKRNARWAIIPGVAIVCGIAATIAWGPLVLLVIGVICLVGMLASLPLIARSDIRRRDRH
jgi:chromate transport protein ChrA